MLACSSPTVPETTRVAKDVPLETPVVTPAAPLPPAVEPVRTPGVSTAGSGLLTLKLSRESLTLPVYKKPTGKHQGVWFEARFERYTGIQLRGRRQAHGGGPHRMDPSGRRSRRARDLVLHARLLTNKNPPQS
jgi:hypothetical protein